MVTTPSEAHVTSSLCASDARGSLHSLRRGPGGKVATLATLPQSPRWEAGVGRVSPECQLAFRSMGQRTRAEVARAESAAAGRRRRRVTPTERRASAGH